MFKHSFKIILTAALLLLLPLQTFAGPKEDYENAHGIYIMALACMAAYHDKGGSITFTELKHDGWQIQPYSNNDKYADASFFYATKKNAENGKTIHFLAITGTEDRKDIKVDARWAKTPFDQAAAANETNPQDTGKNNENAANDTIPQVHTGFLQYLNSVTNAKPVQPEKDKDTFGEFLRANPDEKIILTGHSLGGAVAVLGGAKLLDTGINKDQVQIVTFGAPAVGNKAFAEKFQNDLNLIRVVNYDDPVPGALQKVPGGYVQFGQEVEFKLPKYIKSPYHRVATYLDAAMRNYFDARFKAQKENVIPLIQKKEPAEKGSPLVYVAPIMNNLPPDLTPDYTYMREILLDGYKELLPGYLISEKGLSAKEVISQTQTIKDAKAAGCDMVVFSEINGHGVKTKTQEYYITLAQMFFDTDGNFLRATSFANNTNNLTPLIALTYNTRNMNEDYLAWIKANKKE